MKANIFPRDERIYLLNVVIIIETSSFLVADFMDITLSLKLFLKYVAFVHDDEEPSSSVAMYVPI